MSNIRFIKKKDNKEEFTHYWKSFLEKNNHSILFNLEYIDYYDSYCKDIIDDLSFVAVKGENTQAICFLPIEKIENENSISLSKGYVPAPCCLDKKIEKIVFEEIETIVKIYNIIQIKFYQDPNLEFYESQLYNKLKRYSFIETNNLNLTIDLTQNEPKLWSNLSKSFKSLINKYKKNSLNTLHIMDKSNLSWDIMKQFYKLHKEIAGENARKEELFKAQYTLIEKGLASLYFIKNSEQYLSFSLFFHYNQFVLYVSSVSKELENKDPLSHYTLWNATLNFKKLNYKLIQYNQPSSFTQVSGLDDFASEKELAIASFKRNMGATTTTLYRGIKYYKKELLKQQLYSFYKSWEKSEEKQ